jgi:hypothetical protein
MTLQVLWRVRTKTISVPRFDAIRTRESGVDRSRDISIMSRQRVYHYCGVNGRKEISLMWMNDYDVEGIIAKLLRDSTGTQHLKTPIIPSCSI